LGWKADVADFAISLTVKMAKTATMKSVLADLQAMYRHAFSKCGLGGDPGEEFVEFWCRDLGLGQNDFLDQLGESLVNAFLSGFEDANFFSWAVTNLHQPIRSMVRERCEDSTGEI